MANLPSDELPGNFDVIVEGTGLVQSILAAAVARVGKSVLHIDRNGYYGELWASLMHRELKSWIESVTSPQLSEAPSSHAPNPTDEHAIVINNGTPTSIRNVVETVHGPTAPLQTPEGDIDQGQPPEGDIDQGQPPEGDIDQGQPPEGDIDQGQPPEGNIDQGQPPEGDVDQGQPPEGDEEPRRSVADLMSWQSLEPMWRRFSYDLIPKVLYCRGSLVELLTQSNCGRYVEFKAVQKIYTLINGKVDQVPCSRSDVFSSQSVTMMEKRKMMKFLTFCSDFQHHPEEFEEFVDVPFGEFLKRRDLPQNLITYIVHSIAMVEHQTPTLQGLEATQVFINSLGRFGNAPFLYPIFGAGELGQAFCRLCAVFGGVYCLRQRIDCLLMNKDTSKLSGIMCSNGQRIETSAVVCSAGLVRDSIDIGENLQRSLLSRAVLITDGPLPGTEGKMTVLTIPPLSVGSAQTTSVRVLQLDPSTNCTAPQTYMLHLMCASVGPTAQGDLEHVVRTLCDTQNGTECERCGPRVLWSLYFNVALHHINETATTDIPNGVYLTSDPDTTMAYESVVKEARRIFSLLLPGEEFLPTPPDPRDIIYDDPHEGVPPETNEQSPVDETEGGATCNEDNEGSTP